MSDRLTIDLVRTAERLAEDLGEAGIALAGRARALAEETVGTGRRMLLEDRFAGEGWVPALRSSEARPGPEPFAPGIATENYDDTGLPYTFNTFVYDDYKTMYEQRLGRPLTEAEDRTLREGCIGVTRLRLNNADFVPMHMAFADPAAHGLVAETDRLLAQGEAGAKWAQYNYDRYIETRQQIYRLRVAMRDGNGGRDVLGRIRELEKTSDYWEGALQHTREHNRAAWAAVGEHRAAAARVRSMARIVEGRRGFALVSGYADRYEAILAERPRDDLELQQWIKADPVLSQVRNAHLPIQPGIDPSKLEPVVYAKHFWTGQGMGLDAEGRRVPQTFTSPNAQLFAPDPVTGQVDMAGDLYQGKFGHTNFDYGWYDRGSDTWWNANHRVFDNDPSRPMLVYQNTPDTFFRSHDDFDARVFGIALVEKVI